MAEMEDWQRREAVLGELDALRKLQAQGGTTPEQDNLIQQIDAETVRLGWAPASGKKWGTPQPPAVLPPNSGEATEAFFPLEFAISAGGSMAARGLELAGKSALRQIGHKLGRAGHGAFDAWVASMVDASPGGKGALAGEAAGALLGVVPGAGTALRVALPTAGAVAGYMGEHWLTGQKPTVGGVVNEGVMTMIPHTVKEVGLNAIRGILRSTYGGQRLREEDLAMQVRNAADVIFNPPGKEHIKQAYNTLYETNTPIFMRFGGQDNKVTTFLKQLPDNEYKEIRKIFDRWPGAESATGVYRDNQGHRILDTLGGISGTVERKHQVGFRPRAKKAPEPLSAQKDMLDTLGQMNNTIMSGPADAIGISTYDQFRQYVNAYYHSIPDSEIARSGLKTRLGELKDNLDDVMIASFADPRTEDFLRTTRPGMTAQDVKNLVEGAREGHALNVAADTWTKVATSREVTHPDTRFGTFEQLNLGNLKSKLRDPQTKAETELFKRLDRVPGAREAYDQFYKRLENTYSMLDVDPSSTAGRKPMGNAIRQSMSKRFARRLSADKGLLGRPNTYDLITREPKRDVDYFRTNEITLALDIARRALGLAPLEQRQKSEESSPPKQ